MKTIYLLTSNPGKVASFTAILQAKKASIDIQILNESYPEDKETGTTTGVVLAGAQYCAQKYKKSVLVQDTGLFITALHWFPGVNTKFSLERIGNEWIIKLLEDKKDRTCERIFSLWYCEPGTEPIAFTDKVPGTIANKITGNTWFGFDPIFIPQGYTQTFGEDTKLRDTLSPFHQSIDRLVETIAHT